MKAALTSRRSVDMDTMFGVLDAPSAATRSSLFPPTEEAGLASAFRTTDSPAVYGATAHIAAT